MKKISFIVGTMAILTGLFSSCKKSSTPEKTVLSTPPLQIGQAISDTTTGGAVKGTMLSGHHYSITRDLVINIGDTLLVQSGVTVCIASGKTIIVKGVLISLGTKDSPNWFTACGITKIDQVGNDVTTDPAWVNGNGNWCGINCDTSCRLLDLQWTHVDFTGAAFPYTEPFVGGASGNTSFGILFQNPNGDMIMTDSWMYGCVDDAIRFAGGRICLFRNTLEKLGFLGGDGFNAKHGTQGDMAYNLFIGDATNSTKCSDKGSGSSVQCNINMYNNTYINCGYRQASPVSRGSDIDYEQGGRGVCYNNLIINCRNGIRIGDGQNGIPMPDTTNTIYGYNYIYADSGHEVNQFFPIQAGTWTRPGAYIVPSASQLNLPAGFYNPSSSVNGGDDLAYNDSTTLAGVNNPMFVNFPLPEPVIHNLGDIASIATGIATTGKNYDFHLKAGSPAIGKGYTGFSSFANIANPVSADVTKSPFAPTLTAPGKDMGCYQTDGSGNQH